jgi:hypothetical protein
MSSVKPVAASMVERVIFNALAKVIGASPPDHLRVRRSKRIAFGEVDAPYAAFLAGRFCFPRDFAVAFFFVPV